MEELQIPVMGKYLLCGAAWGATFVLELTAKAHGILEMSVTLQRTEPHQTFCILQTNTFHFAGNVEG